MRLVVGLFAMFLTASVARADEAKAPEPKPEVTRAKVPLRVVRMLPESHQALLFDKTRGTHVLAEVGETVEGYTVEDIDDDEVTLSANGREVVLAAPDPSWRRRDDARTEGGAAHTAKKVVAKAEIAPVDPYAEPVADAPIDPYAEPAVRAVDAPAAISAGEGGMRVASASPVSAALPDPYADLPAPTPSAPKATAPSTPPAFVPPGTPAAPAFVPPGTPAQTRAPVAPAALFSLECRVDDHFRG